ncbi:MAG: sodium:calcium antiporter [Candidatus Manganitrophaceae bacterium]|nr:MAG: sodium:calcium antiporter [Candidatus Manganitrophaceae bacterium]
MSVWAEWTVCATMILISGSLLSRYADMAAEKTGMGRTWIGIILLATMTSLPEMATGLSAVTAARAPDLAAGDVLGSCVFNLMLIGLIDLFHRPGPILSRVDQGHILSAGFGVLLIGMVAWGLLIPFDRFAGWRLWFGPTSLLILLLYAVAVGRVFQFEKDRMARDAKGGKGPLLQYQDIPAAHLCRGIALHGAVIVAAGIWLPFIGGRISTITGWGDTFVGNLLVAAATSLPEIVTSFAAMRLGAPDLAIANLFGSNLFNMAILALDDLAFVEGALLSHVSTFHLFSAVAALMMTGIAITGLIYRTQRKRWGPVSWDGAALIILYLLNLLFVFSSGNSSP